MLTHAQRTAGVAVVICAALLASGSSFALADSVVAKPPNDRVGTFDSINAHTAPADVAGTPTTRAVPAPRPLDDHDQEIAGRDGDD